MALSDPIADFLTRIRNAIGAQHKFVDIRWSKLKQNIADILVNQGFIESYLVKHDNKNRGTIRIFLKYQGRAPVINGLRRISKPGSRSYISKSDIRPFFGGLGVQIVSTSQGVMSGVEAKSRNLGGELLCLVW